MARQTKDTLLEGFSGTLGGQMVVRQTAHGVVLAVRPHGKHTDSPKQKQWREKFAQAIEYADKAQHDPTYETLAKKRNLSGFNVATADFLHPPELRSCNLDAYHGKVGDLIKVRAVDDVKVVTVGIIIYGPGNVLIEQGTMVQDRFDKTTWTYQAKAEASCAHVKVLVDIADLPGHVTHETVEKDI